MSLRFIKISRKEDLEACRVVANLYALISIVHVYHIFVADEAV
jgi:hypothetical protein